MNKEELVKKAYEGYIETSEDENKIVASLNTFDEAVEEELNKLHIDDDEYYYKDDEKFEELISELNRLLIEMFEKNGYTIYESGDIYAENGNFEDVMPDTVVAIK